MNKAIIIIQFMSFILVIVREDGRLFSVVEVLSCLSLMEAQRMRKEGKNTRKIL